jgi:simple sugar transport system permease protein
MDWSQVFQWAFIIALLTAGIRLAVPVLLATLGEIITERAGVLNLGLEGIMAVGGLAGFSAAYYLENGMLAGGTSELPAWLGLVAGMVAGALMGALMAFLSITLLAEQVIRESAGPSGGRHL